MAPNRPIPTGVGRGGGAPRLHVASGAKPTVNPDGKTGSWRPADGTGTSWVFCEPIQPSTVVTKTTIAHSDYPVDSFSHTGGVFHFGLDNESRPGPSSEFGNKLDT